MIVCWIVTCDECKKWIDGKEEQFYQHDYYKNQHLCSSCYDKLDKEEQVSYTAFGGEE